MHMNMSLLRHVLRYPLRFASFRRPYSAMSSLKQGEFVGSLDCGTTYVPCQRMTKPSLTRPLF